MDTGNNFKGKGVRRVWSVLILAVVLVVSGSQNIHAQTDGGALFKQNCSSCHFASTKRGAGPGLQGVTSRRTTDWLMKWIKNPAEMVASGDPQAVAIMKEFNNFPMPPQNLKDEEITSILKYIDDTEIAAKEKAKADSLAKAAAVVANPVQVKPQFMSTQVKWALFIVAIVAVLAFFFLRRVNNVMVESVGRGMPYLDYSEGGQMEKWLKDNKAFAMFFALFLILCCLRFIWVFIGYL